MSEGMSQTQIWPKKQLEKPRGLYDMGISGGEIDTWSRDFPVTSKMISELDVKWFPNVFWAPKRYSFAGKGTCAWEHKSEKIRPFENALIFLNLRFLFFEKGLFFKLLKLINKYFKKYSFFRFLMDQILEQLVSWLKVHGVECVGAWVSLSCKIK